MLRFSKIKDSSKFETIEQRANVESAEFESMSAGARSEMDVTVEKNNKQG
jgi:hypothetical protein